MLSALAPIVDYKEEVLKTLIPYWGLTWDEVEPIAKSAANDGFRAGMVIFYLLGAFLPLFKHLIKLAAEYAQKK